MQAAEKNLDLAYVADDDLPVVVSGDAVRLRQILVNLVGNAVKFTEEGGVMLDVRTLQAATLPADAEPSGTVRGNRVEIHFRVVDTGIGVSQHRLDQLFEAFRQIDASDARRHGGSGLGLAISRRLCELMGGRMWAESKSGHGSTFQFMVVRRPMSGMNWMFSSPGQHTAHSTRPSSPISCSPANGVGV